MPTRRFRLDDSEQEKNCIKCRVSDGKRQATIRLAPEAVDAAHSEGKDLHVQSGDEFVILECKSVQQALQFARYLLTGSPQTVEAGNGSWDYKLIHAAEPLVRAMIYGRIPPLDPDAMEWEAQRVVTMALRMAELLHEKGVK